MGLPRVRGIAPLEHIRPEGLDEAEADCLRDKARRRVVPGYGEEAQRSTAGNTAGIDKPVWPNTL